VSLVTGLGDGGSAGSDAHATKALAAVDVVYDYET
jgi:hypothetical protein